MHILYLHQYFNTPTMSGGTRSYEMARRLVAAGHRVSLITSFRDSSDRNDWYITDEAGIEVHWLPVLYSNKMSYKKRIQAFLRFAARSAHKATSLDGDIVFATSTPLTIALPGIYASWRLRVPMVFEVRDMWPAVPIAMGAIKNPSVIWFSKWLERLAYRKSAHIIALAPGMREDIIQSGISEYDVSVIPNGCDNDLFGSGKTEDPPRRKYEWLNQRKLVLFAGTIGKANGVEYLAYIAHHTLLIDPEIRFVIIGDGVEWENVQRISAKLGVLDCNLFMFPSLLKRELVPWLHAADMVMCLFTGPCVVWKDAVQNKFFDAIAAGKPTASNFDGFQSRVAVEHDIGLILDSRNFESATVQLTAALKNDRWLKDVPTRSKTLAEGRFNRGRLASQLLDILLTVVNNA